MMSENTDRMCTWAKRGLVNWIVHHKEKEEEREVIQGEGKKELAGF